MDITPYLKLMVEKSGSDLFITTDSPIKIKIEGKNVSVGNTLVTGEQTKAAAYGIMNKKKISEFEEKMECDFAIKIADQSRFRVNVFRQRGEVAMVLRLIPNKIPALSQLGVPNILNDLIMNKRGLILMVGATGSGKSTTLAAMINHRNENRTDHILTIEEPIEFYHPNLKGIVSQREVGVDTLSYASALKASLREAPDVILIGEIRDRETMEAALELANNGHLAVSTLHANNANQAMERVINMFPHEAHKQLFMDLSMNIRAVVSQRLIRGIDGKRCAAIEILINTPHIQELISKGNVDELKVAMNESGQRGMQTFDVALHNLYKDGRIELEEALNNADSRTDLENRIGFG